MTRPRRRDVRFKEQQVVSAPLPIVPPELLSNIERKWPVEIPESMRHVHRVLPDWPGTNDTRRFKATGALEMFEHCFQVTRTNFATVKKFEALLSPSSSVDDSMDSPVTPSTSVLLDNPEIKSSSSEQFKPLVRGRAETKWLSVPLVAGKEHLGTTVAPDDIFGPQHHSPDMERYYANSLSPEPPSSIGPDDSAFTDSRRTSISLGSSDFDFDPGLPPSISPTYGYTSVSQGLESCLHPHGSDQTGLLENRYLQSTPLRAGLYPQHSTPYLGRSGPSEHGAPSYQYLPYTASYPSFDASYEFPSIEQPRGPSPLPSGNNLYPQNQQHSGMPQFASPTDHHRSLFATPDLLSGSPTRNCAASSSVAEPYMPSQPYTYRPSSFETLVYPTESLTHPVSMTPHPNFVGLPPSYNPVNEGENWTPQLGHIRLPQQHQPSVEAHHRLDPSSGPRPAEKSPVGMRAPQSTYQLPPSQTQPPKPPSRVRAPKARSPVTRTTASSSSSKGLDGFDASCVLPAISPYEVNRASSWTAHFEALGRKGRKKKKYHQRKGRESDKGKENLLQSPKSAGPILHQCPLCPRKFERRNGLAIHLKWHYKARESLPPIHGLGIVVSGQSSRPPAPPNSPDQACSPEVSSGDSATPDGSNPSRTNALSIDNLLNVPGTPSDYHAPITPLPTPPSSPGGTRSTSLGNIMGAPRALSVRSDGSGSMCELFGSDD